MEEAVNVTPAEASLQLRYMELRKRHGRQAALVAVRLLKRLGTLPDKSRELTHDEIKQLTRADFGG